MPIFILVGKVVLLVCIKSGLIMSFPARTINKTPLNYFHGNDLKQAACSYREANYL